MEEKELNEKVTEEKAEELVEAPAPTEDAVLEEKAPAPEAPAPKKKKLKKWQIALICVAAFVVLVGIGVGIFLIVGAINARPRDSKNVDFKNSAPAFEVSYTEAELDVIALGMKEDATEADVKAAIALIYNKANYNKIHNVDSCVAVLRGEGTAAVKIWGMSASGTMIVRGIKAQSGDEFYYQKAAPIMQCSSKTLQPTLEDMLNQQERVYTNGTNDFRATGTLKGPEAKILTEEEEIETETIPFVKVEIPDTINSYDKETFYYKGYYLQDPREITNFNITADAIVLKPLAEGEKYIELVELEDGAKYYLCRFSIDVTNESCVETARRYLRDSAGSENLEYGYFNVKLEVWENGYLKQMHDDEEWHGTLKKGPITCDTSSTSWYETIAYYDYDAKILTEADAAEYKGDDEGATWVKRLIAHYKKEVDSIG